MSQEGRGHEHSRKSRRKLKSRARAKGITQKQIAAEINKYQSDYSDYETGKVELDYEKIVFFCKRFDITPNELFGIFDK